MAQIHVNPTNADDWWRSAPLAEDRINTQANALIRNDVPAKQLDRAEVAPTRRVWGDAEAEAAGLYEPPKGQDDWWKAAPLARQGDNQFAPSGNTAQLESGLKRKAAELTAGPETSVPQRLALDYMNQGSAAGQRTTPNLEAHSKNLISADVFESDSGEVMFRDPTTGQVIPTDQNKHVALRDPADNRVKVFSRTADTDEGGLSAAGRLLSTGMLAGAPTARPAIPAMKNAGVRASDTFATAKPLYREFEKVAAATPVSPKEAAGYGDRIRGALDNANFIEDLAKPVYSALASLDKSDGITLDHLQKVKRVVGRSFNSPDKNIRDAAGVASAEINRIIADVAPEAARSLKQADAIHSTAKAMQELQRKQSVADLRKGRAGYGGNAVNNMRQLLSPIVQRAVEGRVTGFKPDEIQAMREIVEGTAATNILRGVGQLSPSKGIIQTVGAGGAMYAAGPVALAIPAIGAASNKLATILTGKQIDHVRELVSKRSPAYAAAISKAVERYDRSQIELINSPSPNKFAGYLSASRALSSGLARDGIKVSSGDLLRLIQSPVKSAAEEDQPEMPRVPAQ